jgi:adenylate kinase
MYILILGGQGSGKSTCGAYIAEKLNIPYISTGNFFRDLESEESERGEKIKNLMQSGSLIPDDLAIETIEEYLKKFDIEKGAVLDGYPRTVYQAKKTPFKFDRVFYIKVPTDIAVDRLMKRGRYDDTKELIKRRLDLYREKTKPLLDFFRDSGVSIDIIDNSGSPEELKKQLDDLLQDRL